MLALAPALWIACTVPSSGTDGAGDGGLDDGGLDDGGLDDGGLDDGGTSTDGDTTPDDSGGDDPDDSGIPYEPVVVVEEIGDQPADIDAAFFTVDAVHAVDIVLSEDAIDGLYASPYDWVEGAATVDGEPFGRVGVRLRGKIGSFRELSGKPKLRVDFNQFVEDQRFLGHESLTLNNAIVDCSFLKEPIAYTVFRATGVPASRTTYAQVTVNGAEYGLYVVIETTDDRFLARHYDDPDGNLYDGKYRLWPDGSYTLLDFASGVDDLFELEEGSDVGNADIAGVSAVVAENLGTGRFDEGLGEVVDLERLHALLAAEQWTGQNDGYALNTNNYRVYFDPEDGRAELVPWDLDYSFLYASDWGFSWGSPRGVLAAGCWADESCVAAQREAVADLLDTVDGLDLPGLSATLQAATAAPIAADPRRECSDAYVGWYVDHVDGWIDTRSGTLAGWWGVE
ncbi:MAG: CotH kinase family protein [Alphaproteobacteria bacterium]|nr:CotH kinase family protein [Alphaproteobacteria bacterium]